MSADHTNPKVLSKLYHEEGLTIQQVADKCNVARGTIQYHMDKHDIKARRHGGSHGATFGLIHTDAGHEAVKQTYEENQQWVRIHRLCAIAWFGEAGEAVHHRNGIPWDNREENLQNMTQQEHGKIHGAEGGK